MDVTGGMIHEDATTTVHLVGLGLAIRIEETATGPTDEVIDGDGLTRKSMIGFQDACVIANRCTCFTGSMATFLTSKHACGALGRFTNGRGGLMKTTSAFGMCKSTGAHEKLDFTKRGMSQTLMPSE